MEPPSFIFTFFFIILALVLVFLNAFFVAAEFAIVKVRRTRLEELAGQGVRTARISLLCVDQLDEYLSATQLGITLVSLALGWIGEESFYSLFMLFFPADVSGESATYHIIATCLSFFIITLLHVVLGELVPKSMAIQRAEQVTLAVTKPLMIFYKCTKPLISAFTSLANIFLKKLGFHGYEEPALSVDELKIVMKESHEEGVITESEAKIINQAFNFSDKRVSDILIPLNRVEYLSLEKTFEENIIITKSKMHTRFPLTRVNNLNTVIGVLHTKDVMHALPVDNSNGAFEKAARPALFVDPTVRLDKLMLLFKEQRAHLAIVQDPQTKSNIGILTMEDILEQLVGEILDEHGN